VTTSVFAQDNFSAYGKKIKNSCSRKIIITSNTHLKLIKGKEARNNKFKKLHVNLLINGTIIKSN